MTETAIPSTAAARSRMIRQALREAGYDRARVTSTPASHAANSSAVDQVDDLEAVAAYLTGYLRDLATVRPLSPTSTFVFIVWHQR